MINHTIRKSKYTFAMNADDKYEQQNDTTGGDIPSGNVNGDDYKSRTGQYEVPVQGDDAPVNDPIDPANADSDETLGMHFSLKYICYPVTKIFSSG